MSLPLLLLFLLTAGETPPINMADFYPDRARRLDIEGKVLLQCDVLETGLMGECVVLEETPPDHGFGDAALKMSRLFKMKPMIRDGVPVAGGKVKVPLAFKLPEDPPIQPLSLDEALVCYGAWSARADRPTAEWYDRFSRKAFEKATRQLGSTAGVSRRDLSSRMKAAVGASATIEPMPQRCKDSRY